MNHIYNAVSAKITRNIKGYKMLRYFPNTKMALSTKQIKLLTNRLASNSYLFITNNITKKIASIMNPINAPPVASLIPITKLPNVKVSVIVVKLYIISPSEILHCR